MLPLYFTIITIVVLFTLNKMNMEAVSAECLDKISDYRVTSIQIQEDDITPDELKHILSAAIVVTNDCNELLTDTQLQDMNDYIVDYYSILYNKEKEKENEKEDEDLPVNSKVIEHKYVKTKKNIRTRRTD